MKQSRQSDFPNIKQISRQFGGDSQTGKRKERRPLSTEEAIHLVIKSESIKKETSFVKHQTDIRVLLTQTARKFGVRIYSHSVNFNHLHLLIKFSHRDMYVRFIRVLSSAIVGLLESKAGRRVKKLFEQKPFTRIVAWGRDFKHMLTYIGLNHYEAMGVNVWGRYDNRRHDNNIKRADL